MKQLEMFPDVFLEPTPAIKAGEALVFQCNWCGALICVAAKVKLGGCPACERHSSWWQQELPVGPFRARGTQ